MLTPSTRALNVSTHGSLHTCNFQTTTVRVEPVKQGGERTAEDKQAALVSKMPPQLPGTASANPRRLGNERRKAHERTIEDPTDKEGAAARRKNPSPDLVQPASAGFCQTFQARGREERDQLAAITKRMKASPYSRAKPVEQDRGKRDRMLRQSRTHTRQSRLPPHVHDQTDDGNSSHTSSHSDHGRIRGG